MSLAEHRLIKITMDSSGFTRTTVKVLGENGVPLLRIESQWHLLRNFGMLQAGTAVGALIALPIPFSFIVMQDRLPQTPFMFAAVCVGWALPALILGLIAMHRFGRRPQFTCQSASPMPQLCWMMHSERSPLTQFVPSLFLSPAFVIHDAAGDSLGRLHKRIRLRGMQWDGFDAQGAPLFCMRPWVRWATVLCPQFNCVGPAGRLLATIHTGVLHSVEVTLKLEDASLPDATIHLLLALAVVQRQMPRMQTGTPG